MQLCVVDTYVETELAINRDLFAKLVPVNDHGVSYLHSTKASKMRKSLGFIIRNILHNKSEINLYKICISSNVEYC